MYLVILLLAVCLSGVHGQQGGIDEIIAAAVEDVGSMDYVQDDDSVLVELDMKFKREDWDRIQEEKNSAGTSRKKRKAIRFQERRWTNKVVPYFLSNVFTSSDLAEIRGAFADWERYTCLDFRPYQQGDSNYIYLQNGAGCSSFVGMVGGSQTVSLARGCRSKGVIVHELGHAIGFQHEQTRPDRDSYVTIYFQNIQRGVEYNFEKYTTATVNDYGVPYDYTSVMHYGSTAFSINGQPTIVTKDPANQKLIGNRYGHSFRDIKLANLMYSCSSGCSSKTCSGEGFVGKDCQCWCPGNPVTLCQNEITTTTSRPKPTTTSGGGGGGGGEGPDISGYRKYHAQGCPGNLIEFFSQVTAYQCSALCSNLGDCVAFEYNTAISGCYLKGVCDEGSLVSKTQDENAYIKISTGPEVTGYIKYQAQGCPGNLIEFSTQDRAYDCASLCNNLGDCVAFEYDSEINGCFLKRVCNADTLVSKTDHEAAYIKIITGVQGYTAYPREGCPGNLLEYSEQDSPDKCGSLCDNKANCVAYEYNSAINGCYLKTVCDKNNLVAKTETETAYIKNGGCQDGNQHCSYWSNTGECEKNPEYMLVYCKKSCKVC